MRRATPLHPHLSLIWGLLSVFVLAASPGPPSTAVAGAEQATPADDPAQATVPADGRISPALARVPVDGSEYERLRALAEQTRSQLEQVTRARDEAARAIDQLRLLEDRSRLQAQTARTRRVRAEAELAVLQSELEAAAVGAYVRGSAVPAVDLDWEDAVGHGSSITMFDAITEHHVEAIGRTRTIIERSGQEEAQAGALLAVAGDQRERSEQIHKQAAAAAAVLEVDLREQEQQVADARVTARVTGADFQLVALDSYYRAAEGMAARQPSCRLRWQVLAGISRVEGRHGTWRGSRVGADGRVSRDIIGVPLDGTRGTALVRDTDAGALDGDADFDRAVGPMQFLPTSWARYGADGNGDGEADPQNLYDASMAAGNLLCSASSGLDLDEGLERALLRYNHSSTYVRVVKGHIASYDALPIPDTDLPDRG